MYKAGKLWVTATIISLSLLFVTTTANADQQVANQTTAPEQTTIATVTTQNVQGDSANVGAVTQSSQAAATNNATYGNLDNAKLGADSIRGYQQLEVSGWNATNASKAEPYHYMIAYDNTTNQEVYRHRVTSTVSRNDVYNVYPNVTDSKNSGFNDRLYIPNSVIANGNSISLVSRYTDDNRSGEGNHTDYWFAPIKFDISNRANLDNVAIKNNQVIVSGWHISNQVLNNHPYHYIIAYDATQHREIARQRVDMVNMNNGHVRRDVANAFPLVANAGNSGFNVQFNLRPEFINDQIQFVSRWTNDVAGNGNAIDYWFAPQMLIGDKSNRANLDSFSVRNGKLNISGWHATNLSLGKNYHTIILLNANNGRELARQTVSHVQRADVARVFPTIMTATDSGFNANFAIRSEMFNAPLRIVSRWSSTSDANENYVDFWFAPINSNKQDSWLDKLEFESDGYFSHTNYLDVAGWHADNMAAIYPHHFIILYDGTTNRELARKEVTNTPSSDVARAYGDILNAGQSRFNTTFEVPTDAFFNNHILRIISRYSDSSNGEGHYSQQWIANKALNVPYKQGDYLYDRAGNAYRIPTDSPEHVAQLIARLVGPVKTTQLAQAQLVAKYINAFCNDDRYTMSGPYYSKPYGVFIAHEFSCAGGTRATGLVLNYLGYSYRHVNENQYTHQWCEVTLDGRKAWVDGTNGVAGYGDY